MKKAFIFILTTSLLLQNVTIFASPFDTFDTDEVISSDKQYTTERTSSEHPFGNPDSDYDSEAEESSPTRASIQTVNITTSEAGETTLTGKTTGFTDNMTIVIKIIDKDGKLHYFDDLVLKGNSFNTSFNLSEIADGSDLMLKISGDLIYTKQFPMGIKEEGPVINKPNTGALDSYVKNELGSFVDYGGMLSFGYEYYIDDQRMTITMTGSNFRGTDAAWTNRTMSRWQSYLEVIADKAISLYNVPVTISVLDSGLVAIDYYAKDLSTRRGMTAKEVESMLNRDFRSYTDSKSSLRFSYSVKESSTSFEISMNGYFLKGSDSYKNMDKKAFNQFLENIGKTLEIYVYKDINISVYDQLGDLLLKNSFYVESLVEEGKTYEYFETLQEVLSALNEKESNVSNTDLVEMLKYGKNSVTVAKENTLINSNGLETQISISNIQSATNQLKDEGYLVVKCATDSNSYKFFNSSELTSLLIAKKAKLVVVVPDGELVLDFSRATESFNIDMTISKSGDPLSLSLDADSFASKMNNGIEGVIRYNIDQTSIISDTRTLGIFHTPTDKLVPSRTVIDKQGIAFNYVGKGAYKIRDNGKYFIDTDNHWGQSTINIVSAKDMIVGIGDNQYAPERTITRAEFISMIMRNLGLDKPFSGGETFKDVSSDKWYYNVVNESKKQNILPPTMKDTLKPDQPITREEIIYITMACYDLNPELREITDSAIFFGDKAKISDWAMSGISRATELKIVAGYKNNVNPKDNATRAEAATILMNLLKLQNNL